MRDLTPAQLAVLERMAAGDHARHGAEVLGIAPATYRTHVQSILVRLRAHTAAGAVGRAYQLGILTDREGASMRTLEILEPGDPWLSEQTQVQVVDTRGRLVSSFPTRAEAVAFVAGYRTGRLDAASIVRAQVEEIAKIGGGS